MGDRALRLSRRGFLLAVAAAPACALLRPARLDLSPGQRAVLGRLDTSRFRVPQATIWLVREDGTFTEAVSVGLGRSEFAVALPPGRYRITELRAVKDQEAAPDRSVWPLHLAFVVGPEPAVYIGTLRVVSVPPDTLRVWVADEYEDTVRTLRGLYADIPLTIERRLMTPA